MRWVVTKAQLSEALLEHMDDQSFSVAFISSEPSAGDILAVRQAARLCDVVVVAVQGSHLHERYKTYLEGAGADIVYVESTYNLKSKSRLVVNGKADGTFFLKTILKVLPLVVTVSAAKSDDVQTLKAISHEFDGLFSLVTQEMSPETMTAKQRKVRTSVGVIRQAILAGEKDVYILQSLCEKTLKEQGVMGEVAHEFVAEDLSSIGNKLTKAGHYFMSVRLADEIIHDGIQFGTPKKAVSSLEKSGTYA
jgi:hypothetical protein